jgi:hydrogenase nickel incorporation protein HypA/HybF
MHELSIAMSVLDVVAEEADRLGNAAVKAVHIKLGPLSGVVKCALFSAYALAREATSLAACELIVEDVPIVAYCLTCESEQPIESPQWLCCPVCGTPTPDIVTGRELEVTALELQS